MPVLWFTGFEGGHATKEPFSTVAGSGVTVGSSYARTGTYGCRLNHTAGTTGAGYTKACSNNDGGIDQTFADDTRIHFYLKIITLPPATERDMIMFSYRTGSTLGLAVVLEDDGSLSLYTVDYSSNAVVDLGNTTTTYNDGAWHAIQVKDDKTGGSPSHDYELIVDDVSKVSGSTNLGSAVVDTVYFGKFDDAFDSSYDVYIDDVVITSDAYIDYPFAIERLVPDENGTYTLWTGDYTDVDDIPPNSTDEIRGGIGASSRESFFCENCSILALGRNIAAIKMNYVCKRGGAGDGTHFFMRDSGGTNNDTPTAVGLGAGYIGYATMWPTNPDTSAAWAASEVDAAEIGIMNKPFEGFSTYCDAMQIHVLFHGIVASRVIAGDGFTCVV